MKNVEHIFSQRLIQIRSINIKGFLITLILAKVQSFYESYKPALKSSCKLNSNEEAVVSVINQKYSIVGKGPSID